MSQSLLTKWVFLFSVFFLVASACRDNPTRVNNGPDNDPSFKSFAHSSGPEFILLDTSRRSPDFVVAARNATPAVVHIKVRFVDERTVYNTPFGRLPGRGSVIQGSGSGVTLSEDGYIATNNHVVDKASEIEVIFPDRRSFKATLVGSDPNTDLALIKVDAKDLPVITTGNSDDVQIGEWVLAVGYPLSLNTTVTAGIISAKGRSLGIIDRTREGVQRSGQGSAIESFLQTDAAINPGNSGGALVNGRGELIGINTAIASQTGSYAGYAFAIPVNLAIKVLDDIRNYGSVRRGILGVAFPPPAIEDQYLKQEGIDPGSVSGAYIIEVQKGGAAAAGGLKSGDFIQSVNEIPVSSSAELSEQIARHRPGDKITIGYLRNGKTQTTEVVLKGEASVPDEPVTTELLDRLGASFSPVSARIKEELNLRSGVMVSEVKRGGFFDRVGIPAGTIIVIINGQPVNTAADVEKAVSSARRGLVRMLAIAPDGSRVAFSFSLGA